MPKRASEARKGRQGRNRGLRASSSLPLSKSTHCTQNAAPAPAATPTAPRPRSLPRAPSLRTRVITRTRDARIITRTLSSPPAATSTKDHLQSTRTRTGDLAATGAFIIEHWIREGGGRVVTIFKSVIVRRVFLK